MLEKLNINEWAEADRPREKLAALGAAALSDAELLAILIGSGNADENAVMLMQRVLRDCGNSLKELGRKSIQELTGQYKGIGDAKAITILAACELGRRRQGEELERKKLGDSAAIYAYLHPKMQDLAVEECHVLLLNQGHRLLEDVLVSRGGLTDMLVDVREILRHALLRGAPNIVLAHNHPSGSPKPSSADNNLTLRLQQATALMDIRLLDHLVIVDGGYYSYADEGKL